MLGDETYMRAQTTALNYCAAHSTAPCTLILTVCDPPPQQPALAPPPKQVRSAAFPSRAPQQFTVYVVQSSPLIGVTLFLLMALIAFLARHPIINFIIHGNLPRTLPVYGDDIEVLFKRWQRVNWYGRVIFGITARLGMTEQQLALVRRYWLGRVVAFDSLRRQRQNELARLHVQYAMKAKSDAHDKKKFWSRRWATFRSFVKKLFWVFTAFFSFILGLFFIRVTIAKLARGNHIESKDLVLLLQAKEAIEESAQYLKQYLQVAETFHGEEELFEPE